MKVLEWVEYVETRQKETVDRLDVRGVAQVCERASYVLQLVALLREACLVLADVADGPANYWRDVERQKIRAREFLDREVDA